MKKSNLDRCKPLLAVIVTGVMTLVIFVLRVFLMPRLQDPDTGVFRLSYLVIALMAVTMVVVTVLALLCNRGVPAVKGRMLLPTSVVGILCGAVLLLSNAYDLLFWLLPPHTTPAPNPHVIGTMDGVALFFTILFGILGGLFLIRLGLRWIGENRSRTGMFRLWALTPVAWVWMRLARYEMSYASAVDVSESFYDFVMLIFTLLFFFALARHVSGVGSRPPRFLLVFTLCTGMLSVSGTLTRIVLYLMGQGEAYAASELAGPADLAVGVFALLLGLAFSLPEKKAALPRPVAVTPPAEGMPRVDDLLAPLQSNEE